MLRAALANLNSIERAEAEVKVPLDWMAASSPTSKASKRRRDPPDAEIPRGKRVKHSHSASTTTGEPDDTSISTADDHTSVDDDSFDSNGYDKPNRSIGLTDEQWRRYLRTKQQFDPPCNQPTGATSKGSRGARRQTTTLEQRIEKAIAEKQFAQAAELNDQLLATKDASLVEEASAFQQRVERVEADQASQPQSHKRTRLHWQYASPNLLIFLLLPGLIVESPSFTHSLTHTIISSSSSQFRCQKTMGDQEQRASFPLPAQSVNQSNKTHTIRCLETQLTHSLALLFLWLKTNQMA